MAHGKCAVPTALNSQTSAIFGCLLAFRPFMQRATIGAPRAGPRGAAATGNRNLLHSFVMAAPCPNLDHRDLEDVSYKTHSNLGEKISILVASAPQRFCTAWQTGRADPRSKLRQWRELTKPKYKAFDRWLIQ
jgi:hypothetical protein